MTKLGFAIIGCGRISYKHIEAILNNHKFARLVAVCDVIEESAIEKAEEYVVKGIEKKLDIIKPLVYKEYKDLLKNEEIQVAVIATESGKHAAIAIECMKARKHVIIEKPMALSTSDADQMIELAQEMNVKLSVCHQNRFNPAVQKLRQALEEGRFGKIIAGNARILWNRNEDYYSQANWRGTYELDGGCLMNQCIHNIDLLQWMLEGDIEWVHGVIGNYTHPYIEAEDYGSVQIYFKNGSIGNVEGTVCVYPKNLQETLTIIGEKGTVILGGVAVNKVLVWQFEDEKDDLDQLQRECNEEISNVYGSGHTSFYKNVIDSIIEDGKPYIDGIEGKKAMQIVLCSYASNEKGKRVPFDIYLNCDSFELNQSK